MPPDTGQAEQLGRLASFLSTQEPRLQALWLEKVRANRSLSRAATLSDAELSSHLPTFYNDLRQGLLGCADPAEVRRHTEEHGERRYEQHYTLGEVLEEVTVTSRLTLEQLLDLYEDEQHALAPRHRRVARDVILNLIREMFAGSARRYDEKQRQQMADAHELARRADQAITRAAQADRELLADVFHASPSFIAVLRGPQHVYELANERYCQLAQRDDLIGHPIREMLPEMEEQGYAELLDRVYQTGEPYVATGVSITYPGHDDVPPVTRVLDFAFLPARSADGQITGVLVHGVDWTERSEAQAALVRVAEQRKMALEAADIGWWHLDPGSGQLFMDERFQAIFDIHQGSDRYENVLSRIHPDDREQVDHQVQLATQAETPHPYDVDYRVVHGDGTVRWVSARGKITREGERVTGFFGTALDITAERLAEAEREQLLSAERAARSEAERQSRMKDEFLATLSHELRTPLNAVLGWAQVLQAGGTFEPEEVAQAVAVIERNARAQTQIMEDLLDMSRIVSGKVRLDLRGVELAELVRNSLEAVQPAADARGIRLSLVRPAEVPRIQGDPGRLQQVIFNLLSNAVKFTPRNGWVAVSLQSGAQGWSLTVADSGEGIEPEFLPFVFDRFRQADASMSRRHGGLGLGLSLVKQLVELHGGQVSVESPGKGKGSSFRIFLPFGCGEEPDLEAPVRPRGTPRGFTSPPPSPTINLAGVRVLAVDDEPDSLALVQRLLESRGAIVRTAGSVANAWELFRAEVPDVLVSDIGMPGEDGFSLIRRVRELPESQGGQVPALAVTAYARDEDRVRVVGAGFQQHVSKPVDAYGLLRGVAALAGRGRR